MVFVDTMDAGEPNRPLHMSSSLCQLPLVVLPITALSFPLLSPPLHSTFPSPSYSVRPLDPRRLLFGRPWRDTGYTASSFGTRPSLTFLPLPQNRPPPCRGQKKKQDQETQCTGGTQGSMDSVSAPKESMNFSTRVKHRQL